MVNRDVTTGIPTAHGVRCASGVALVVLGGTALLFFHPVYRSLGPQAVLWIYDLAVVLSALVGTGLSLALWRSFSRGEASRTIWAYLTAGLLLWALGEAIWTADQLLLAERLPQPSAADAAWIFGYVPVTLGLRLRYRSFRIAPQRAWHIPLLGSVAFAVGLVAVTLVLPTIRQSANSRWMEQAVNILYPLGDLLVAYWAILIVSVLAGGALFSPWRFIAAGCLCVALSDLMYAYAVRLDMYQVGPATGVNLATFMINLLYVAAYLSLALGLYVQARLQRAL